MSEDYEDGAYTLDPVFADDHDRDALKKCLHHLGLAKHYAPQWLPRDAFREFYQNWRDGIIESSRVHPQYIKPVFARNDRQEIHITASIDGVSGASTDKGQLLGYIRFCSKSGSLELTNFRAKLDRKHLDLGETTKINKNTLAGGHGEGFKLAALVMRRNGYSVKFETNSFWWNFCFRGQYPRLCCALEPKPLLEQEQRNQYFTQRAAGDFQRGLTPHIWEDMTVKIGKSRDREGAQKVSEQDFREWMKVSIDLDPPDSAQVVHTTRGDLIFDPLFRGRIYLHSLLVAESTGHGQGGKDFRFGYNFNRGKINRDRQRLADAHEEASILAQIWEHAILLKGGTVIDHYVKLFNEDEDAPDIALAVNYTSRLTAYNVCKHLKVAHPEAFFYSERDASEQNATTDEDIISKELKKQPFKLQKRLWQIIRRHPPLMRTPLEERKHLFETSQTVTTHECVFSLSILRSLKASLSLDSKLSNIGFEFLEGADTGIDLLYAEDRNLLQINAKWLDFARVHQESSCEFFKVTGEQMSDDSSFFCDHVVQDLLENVFEEVRAPLGLTPERAACLRRNAVEYLRQMPRAIKITAPTAGNQLEVKWIGNESGAFVERYGANIQYQVTLHRESSCEGKRNECLNKNGLRDDQNDSTESDQHNDSCDCPSRTVSQADSKIIFDGLNHNELYFPMVSRAETPSFFGLPPAPVTPNEATVVPSSSFEPFSEAEPGSISDFSPLEVESDSDEDIQVLADKNKDADEDMRFSIGKNDYAVNGDIEPHRVSAPGTRALAQAEVSSRRPAEPMPDRQRVEQRSESSDRGDSLDAKKDEQIWLDWHRKQLYAHSQLLPNPRPNLAVNGATFLSVYREDINHNFEKDHYDWVQLKDEAKRQIIFVHKIFQHHNRSGIRYCLLVTRYSPLSSIFPVETLPTAGNPAINDQEMILHFGDFDKMRTPEDAETIPLDHIISARRLGTGRNSVRHVFQHPGEADFEGLFCRFGICNATKDGVAWLTPLASHLLPHHGDHWERPKFRRTMTPLAFELSPSVLGVSEGFSQAGFKIQAAFGVNEMRHNTWMNRYNTAQPFDGAGFSNVVKDFDSQKLMPVDLPDPVPPKVALFASEYPCFRIKEQNSEMPTLNQFLGPLDAIDEAIVGLNPDFFVLLLPPAMLHSSAIARFSETILGLLKARFSLHLAQLPLRDYGLPQDRSIVAIVASPFRAPLSWALHHYLNPGVNICDLIKNLTFENSRIDNVFNTGFVCSPPTTEGPEQETPLQAIPSHVYNHYTGIHVATDAERISMDSNAPFTRLDGRKELVHPVRKDRVTVRELARLQGIPDDLRFFGTKEEQYETVCKAIPPIISRMIAHAIRDAIRSSQVVTISNAGGGFRRNKRARLEDAAEDR